MSANLRPVLCLRNLIDDTSSTSVFPTPPTGWEAANLEAANPAIRSRTGSLASGLYSLVSGGVGTGLVPAYDVWALLDVNCSRTRNMIGQGGDISGSDWTASAAASPDGPHGDSVDETDGLLSYCRLKTPSSGETYVEQTMGILLRTSVDPTYTISAIVKDIGALTTRFRMSLTRGASSWKVDFDLATPDVRAGDPTVAGTAYSSVSAGVSTAGLASGYVWCWVTFDAETAAATAENILRLQALTSAYGTTATTNEVVAVCTVMGENAEAISTPFINYMSGQGPILDITVTGGGGGGYAIHDLEELTGFERLHLIYHFDTLQFNAPSAKISGITPQGNDYLEMGAFGLYRAETLTDWEYVGHSVTPVSAGGSNKVTTKSGAMWAEARAKLLQHEYIFDAVDEDDARLLIKKLLAVGEDTPILVFLEDTVTGEIPQAYICHGYLDSQPIVSRVMGRCQVNLRMVDAGPRG